MKLRDYKKHTFTVCKSWVFRKTARNTDRLAANLRRWVNNKRDGELRDYGYKAQGTGLSLLVSYCADRMNAGRAKAILRLLDEDSSREPEYIFDREGR